VNMDVLDSVLTLSAHIVVSVTCCAWFVAKRNNDAHVKTQLQNTAILNIDVAQINALLVDNLCELSR
jgi:hypothetical protein